MSGTTKKVVYVAAIIAVTYMFSNQIDKIPGINKLPKF